MSTMKKFIFLMLSLTLFCVAGAAQTNDAGAAGSTTTAAAEDSKPAKKPRRRAFRPTKEQITQGQTFLKAQGQFSGEATGKYSPEFRAALKVYQEANGLSKTGRLDRETLEKMGIALTESQQGM